MQKPGYKSLPQKIRNDRLLLFAFILTVPSIIIWSFGMISYLWSLLLTHILLRLPPWGSLIILLIIPFTAFVLGTISYLKNKKGVAKKIFLLNLFFVLLAIVFSILLS